MASRSTRRTGRVLVAAGAAVMLLAPALAAAEPDPLVGGPAEQELLRLVSGDHLVRAREQAEQILKRQPDAIIAHFALVRVFHDEEANLPRALYHLRRAKRWLLSRYGKPPRQAAAKNWHRQLLLEEEALLGELDRREEQLAVLIEHDEYYRPKQHYRRIWPLMKLHRFDEASRLAREVSLSSDLSLRISALNGMIAIEMEQLKPLACYRVAMNGVLGTSYRSCILLHNTAEAAFAVYKFDEVERLANKALQAPLKDCPNSSYPHLANLYLLRGDFQRAMQAVRSARQEGIERRYRQQFEMENKAWLFRLLYALGRFEMAREIGEQVQRAPDRMGMTSTPLALRQVVEAVEYHAALAARGEMLREEAAVRPLSARLRTWAKLQLLERTRWTMRRRIDRLLAGEVSLPNLIRPYLTPLVPWIAGSLVTATGTGILRQALAEARRRETMPETAAYFAGLEAEALDRAGEYAQALALARTALARLPRDEMLLRGRVAAVAADAAQRLDHRSEAERYFDEALQHFPTALRILALRLPVRVLHDATAPAQRVAALLLRSPRLAPGADGFTVRVTSRARMVRVCLESAAGRRLACVEQTLDEQVRDEAEQAARVADAFHREVFAPRIDLTQRDINSLDGAAMRGDADELIDKVLKP